MASYCSVQLVCEQINQRRGATRAVSDQIYPGRKTVDIDVEDEELCRSPSTYHVLETTKEGATTTTNVLYNRYGISIYRLKLRIRTEAVRHLTYCRQVT